MTTNPTKLLTPPGFFETPISKPEYKDSRPEGIFKDSKKQREVLKGIQELSPFSELFFSDENIYLINNNLKYKIYSLSDNKWILGNQDKNEILIVMRSTYLTHSLNPTKISEFTREIERLNGLTLDYMIPIVIGGIKDYQNYLVESTKISTGTGRPVNTSSTGLKLDYNKGYEYNNITNITKTDYNNSNASRVTRL